MIVTLPPLFKFFIFPKCPQERIPPQGYNDISLFLINLRHLETLFKEKILSKYTPQCIN